MRGYGRYFIHQSKNLPNIEEGKIVQRGWKKIAAYREPNGKLNTFSAICPHLKAIISWNGIEKSWDCPAHGSRFGLDGKILNGPTCLNLSKCSLERNESERT